jgi:ABC-type transporter Mla subunit MlaD
MSDNQITEMSKVIGQIEDELRDIKSAKEQVEAVIGSNKALSDSLQALFDSANNVAKALEVNAQQIITDINNKLEMLNVKASDIESYAQQGMSKISEQSALAQSKLEEELGNLVQQLMATISTSAKQSLEAVGNELAEYSVLVHEAEKNFSDSTSDMIAKQEGQIAEIGSLVTHVQEIQNALNSKIEELGQLDIARLFNEISEISRIESENTAATKKWRVIEISAFGGCIVLGIAILIRLLVI